MLQGGAGALRLEHAGFAGVLLIIVAVVVLGRTQRPSPVGFRSSCYRWGCDHPLITDTAGKWPPPRIELPSVPLARWRKLHDQHVLAAERDGQRARVVFLGDSITEGWIRTGLSARGPSIAQPRCQAIWESAFGRWAPINFGVGGDRIQDLGWRLQHGILPDVLKPKVFVLMIGTNDLGNGEPPEVALAELRLLVAQLHAARPEARLLLHHVFPRGGDEGVPRTEGFHRSGWWSPQWNNHHAGVGVVNRGIEALAAKEEWIDAVNCNQRFLARTVDPTQQLPPPSPAQGKEYLRPVAPSSIR